MGVLTRPDLPPGAELDLVEALHDLHLRAGRPSLRALASQVGCSPTTASAVFSSGRVPTWGVLELVVEAMQGDVDAFRRLWLDASSSDGALGASGPAIAGRRDELATVRRHIARGSGLLLVCGEAGIGKSHLVRTAAAEVADDVFVARGDCLPLSATVPLLPVSDLLRSVHAADDGRWVKDALVDAAPYVAEALPQLLPELGTMPGSPPAGDAWARHRLSLAVGTFLGALAELRPLAIVVEDLHWADPATLDLLEHLVVRGAPVPVLATWRTEDPGTTPTTQEWLLRVERLPSVTTLPLGLLTKDETTEQLVLLGADPELTEQIHRRSVGQPLFTEQLAARPGNGPMPELLADLLDRRVDGLPSPQASVADTLAVADRGLDAELLGEATGLAPTALAEALHGLADRRLLRDEGSVVELAHPLLAEAVRRRLVAPERTELHRRLALALAATPAPAAAEVAEHWQAAGDDVEELAWRVRAGREAQARFAPALAGREWRRSLTLWPDGAESAGTPPIRKGELYLAAMDALCFTDIAAAWEVAEAAMRDLEGDTDVEAAETFRQAAYIASWRGDAPGGLELVDRAIRVYAALPPSEGYVKALNVRDQLLDMLGRYAESRVAGALALAACRDLDIPQTFRFLLVAQASHELDAGHLDRSLSCLDEAAALDMGGPDPEGEIFIAIIRTHVLESAGRLGDEVVAAGRPGLEAASEWGLETTPVGILRSNVSAALFRAGQVARAAELVDPVLPEGDPTPEDVALHEVRAFLDMLRGRCAAALSRSERASELPDPVLGNRLLSEETRAGIDLWCGRPDVALDRCLAVLAAALPTDAATEAAAVLRLAARSFADVGEAEQWSRDRRLQALERLRRDVEEARHDPFGPHAVYAARPAEKATWHAECARLVGDATVDLWAAAALQWDELGRPHDAAYCRWRAGEVALATGKATVAGRLLRRAARQAHEHVPLTRAIALTAARTPDP